MGVASPGHARQAQISLFLLVLGTEDVLALSKDTIGTAWASHVFFSKNYYYYGRYLVLKKNNVILGRKYLQKSVEYKINLKALFLLIKLPLMVDYSCGLPA